MYRNISTKAQYTQDEKKLNNLLQGGIKNTDHYEHELECLRLTLVPSSGTRACCINYNEMRCTQIQVPISDTNWI